MLRNFALICALYLAGCASISSLPQSASQANFNDAEGKTGWSKYEDVLFLEGVDEKTAYLAAKAGLADAGFTIKKADHEKGAVFGEHGITMYDWNIVAGVYVKGQKDGTAVKAIVQGSKDTGFWGDHTASSWTQDIFKGVRNYIATESKLNNTSQKVSK